ncbi:MAG TPA: DUF3536 domain-containing protein [Clostridia bacterium]|nr:DUF3536 domain-containing protein [Clostridia bacterium]
MQRYICIHGHFYQPPRENPWLEDIEIQDSAYPFHDWNKRIAYECYAPNAAARILNEDGWIKKIVNNYTKISFNFGPTLLDWIKTKEPEVYTAIIDADKESMKNFSGHGSAIAQAYNHMIMPLANSHDKYTQVAWGIKDFKKHFGRHPKGMWLPETAVDLETLEIMADQGIVFAILAPYQAAKARRIGDDHWHNVGAKGIDTTMPYKLKLHRTGKSINIFFYDGSISQAVAFENLLANGEKFTHRLLSGFDNNSDRPRLVHIATDGETYGHHHRHGEMALAYALHYIETKGLAKITNYSEYLEKFPPSHEVEIHENTAWSCAHCVGRWEEDCGCSIGINPEWNQSWRAPLRQSLNWLRDSISTPYKGFTGQFLKDPQDARNDYIELILDRSPESMDNFFDKHSKRKLNEPERVQILKALEMQRHAMLMFTSCGWFFDELSGIETVQVMQYAGRVIQLAQELFNISYEGLFLEKLAGAKSNIPELDNGAVIYEKFVKPAMVSLPKVGAHFAISSLFEKHDKNARIFCYTIDQKSKKTLVTGRTKLTIGQIKVTSDITRESENLSYAVLYFGHHNISGGAKVFTGKAVYEEMAARVSETFRQVDIPGVLRLLDFYFKKGVIYSLKQLFRDQQSEIVGLILESTLMELEADYRRIYDRHVSLMSFLVDLNVKLPDALLCAAGFYLNNSLRRLLGIERTDKEYIVNYLNESDRFKINLDHPGLGYVARSTIEGIADKLLSRPNDLDLLKRLDDSTGLLEELPFDVDLWRVQNIYYQLLNTTYRELLRQNDKNDNTQLWLETFNRIGDKLQMQRGV